MSNPEIAAVGAAPAKVDQRHIAATVINELLEVGAALVWRQDRPRQSRGDVAGYHVSRPFSEFYLLGITTF
jgi:hypothetical protein